ncbi:hypothetical protein SAMN04489726_7616 [Allokutzneria albata]|uniref:Uncharacterized protein n=1 Tax=Allokutzneria albata TaxID=211114 RepID=A0A1H0D6F7_ALLAB|nr:hypothetical protein SAMN04489726_7616 [Allokutzneria albata]
MEERSDLTTGTAEPLAGGDRTDRGMDAATEAFTRRFSSA